MNGDSSKSHKMTIDTIVSSDKAAALEEVCRPEDVFDPTLIDSDGGDNIVNNIIPDSPQTSTAAVISPQLQPVSTNNMDVDDDENEKKDSSTPRRTRTILTPYQSKVLRKVLDQTLFPSTELRKSLAAMLGIKPRTIQIWFQNQRQKAKIKQQQYDLKSVSPPLTLADVLNASNSHDARALKPVPLSDHGSSRWSRFNGAVCSSAIPDELMKSNTPTIIVMDPQLLSYSPVIASATRAGVSGSPVTASASNTGDPNNGTNRGGGLDILASIASFSSDTSSQQQLLQHHHSQPSNYQFNGQMPSNYQLYYNTQYPNGQLNRMNLLLLDSNASATNVGHFPTATAGGKLMYPKLEGKIAINPLKRPPMASAASAMKEKQ